MKIENTTPVHVTNSATTTTTTTVSGSLSISSITPNRKHQVGRWDKKEKAGDDERQGQEQERKKEQEKEDGDGGNQQQEDGNDEEQKKHNQDAAFPAPASPPAPVPAPEQDAQSEVGRVGEQQRGQEVQRGQGEQATKEDRVPEHDVSLIAPATALLLREQDVLLRAAGVDDGVPKLKAANRCLEPLGMCISKQELNESIPTVWEQLRGLPQWQGAYEQAWAGQVDVAWHMECIHRVLQGKGYRLVEQPVRVLTESTEAVKALGRLLVHGKLHAPTMLAECPRARADASGCWRHYICMDLRAGQFFDSNFRVRSINKWFTGGRWMSEIYHVYSLSRLPGHAAT